MIARLQNKVTHSICNLKVKSHTTRASQSQPSAAGVRECLCITKYNSRYYSTYTLLIYTRNICVIAVRVSARLLLERVCCVFAERRVFVSACARRLSRRNGMFTTSQLKSTAVFLFSQTSQPTNPASQRKQSREKKLTRFCAVAQSFEYS